MGKLKDIPKIDRPRERFLEKGPDALSKSELLAILLGSGIRGKNVKELSEQIIRKYGNKLLDITVDNLMIIQGIGKAKALQIVSAFALIKRFYEELGQKDNIVLSPQDAVSLTSEIRNRKKEHLVCLYLNARNALLVKETISVGILDKSIIHPREIFGPAVELRAAGVILIHNHPSGDVTPSKQDIEVINKILEAGRIMSINVIDFITVSESNIYSFFLKNQTVDIQTTHYISDGIQNSLFDLLETEKKQFHGIRAEKIQETYFHVPQTKANHFQLHSRRYIGNKYKLIDWIFSVLGKECSGESFADIFAGTGVVAAVASKHFSRVVLNDFLYSNYAIYKAFFDKGEYNQEKIYLIIKDYNNINGEDLDENYFSLNFGGKYFSKNTAKLLGFIRENIEENKGNLTEREYYILIASLLYSADKVANTVGHYDAYFRKEFLRDNFFMRPIHPIQSTKEISIFREDANVLAKKIRVDVVYIDPPYNSRQYSRFYHVLETLTKWDKPKLSGTALKPYPENMSDYCKVGAKHKFAELVRNLNAKYLVVSYNNTYNSKSNSSQNKITLEEIKDILGRHGKTKIFEKDYRHFNAGNTDFKDHKEFLFVTKVDHE